MKKTTIRIINLILLLLTFNVVADEKLIDLTEKYRPSNMSNEKWKSLSSTINETKLLPTPVGIGGVEGFGNAIVVADNLALIGSPNTLGYGVVYAYEYDGNNWIQTQLLSPLDKEPGGFGSSISINGNRALIASHNVLSPEYTRKAYIFEFNSGIWEQSAKLIPNIYSNSFASSLSLSKNRAVIGSNFDSNNGIFSGAVYIFDFNDVTNTWNQTFKLLASVPPAAGGFGHSVFIDNNTLVVGSPVDTGNKGAAYVFVYNDILNSWSETNKLIANDGQEFDFFGENIVLSNNRILIGAAGNDTYTGAVYIFEYLSNIWIQTHKLVASDRQTNDGFGSVISINNNQILIGSSARNANNIENSGSAYIFDLDISSNTWNETTILSASDGMINDRFGGAVFLVDNQLLITANNDVLNGNPTGSVYVFSLVGNNWIENQNIVGEDGASGDFFGESVYVSGNRVLIRAKRDQPESVYVFDYDTNINDWVLSTKLIANDGKYGDGFGSSLSMSGDRIVIGAKYYDDAIYENRGTAYIFELDDSTGLWNQTHKLFAQDRSSNDYFGSSISIVDNKIIIGAPNEGDFPNWESGSAYIFELINNVWIETAKLKASDVDKNDFFGSSVTLISNKALIGSPGNDDHGNASGSAYIFDYDTSTDNWIETIKLTASDAMDSGRFGAKVNLIENRALIGGYGFQNSSAYVFEFDTVQNSWSETALFNVDNVSGASKFAQSVSLGENKILLGARSNDDHKGIVFVYKNVNQNWVLINSLKASDGMDGDNFANSVSLSKNWAIVGSPYHTGNSFGSGATYIFNLDFIFSNNFENP